MNANVIVYQRVSGVVYTMGNLAPFFLGSLLSPTPPPSPSSGYQPNHVSRRYIRGAGHPQIRLWRLPAGVPTSPPPDQAITAPSRCSYKPIYQPNHVSRTYIRGEKCLGGQWPAPLLVNQVGPARGWGALSIRDTHSLSISNHYNEGSKHMQMVGYWLHVAVWQELFGRALQDSSCSPETRPWDTAMYRLW